MKLIKTCLILFLISQNIMAQTSGARGPQRFTIQGTIYQASGSAYVGLSNIKFEIRDQNSTCVLYDETHTNVDTSNTQGSYAISLGTTGTRSNKIDNSTNLNLAIFKNNTTPNVTGCGAINLAQGTSRKIRIYIDTGSGFQAMSPDIEMQSLPYAMVAETFDGLTTSDVIKVNSTTALTQTNLETLLANTTNLNNLVTLATTGSAPNAGAAPSWSSITGKPSTISGYGITMSSSDVTTALGFTPLSSSGTIANATNAVNATNAANATTAVNFSGSLSGDVSGTQSAVSVNKIKGITVSSTAPLNGQVLQYNGSQYVPTTPPSAPVSSVAGKTGAVTLTASDISGLANSASIDTTNASNITSGTLAAARLPATVLQTSSTYSGDVSGTVSAMSVDKIKGVTVSVTSITSNDILQYNGTNYVNKNIPTCSANQYLTFNGTSYTCVTDVGSGGSVGSVNGLTGALNIAVGTSGSDANINAASTTITLNLPTSSASNRGLLSSADWTTFNNKLSTSTNHAGDVSGTALAMSVDKIKGQSLTLTANTAGNYLRNNGSGWVNANLQSGDITTALGYTPANSSNLSNYLTTSAFNVYVASANCTSSQTMYWNSVSSTFSCANISLPIAQITGLASSASVDTTNASNITSGTLAAARLPAHTGDVTSSAGSAALTIANSAVTSSAIAANSVTAAKLESGANGQLFIGNGTGFTKATLTAGSGVTITNGSGSITIAASGGNMTSNYGGWPLSCPTGYIPVPALPGYTDKGFCVAKYEMKSNSGAKSEAAGSPWVNISRDTAKTTCTGIGAGYDLITNAQWQTIARNIADVASNWGTTDGGSNSGSAYSGELTRGISNGSQSSGMAASTDDNQGCLNTGQTCSSTVWNTQRRTHTLSNGQVIWDFAGNVWEWVKDDNNAVQGSDGYMSTMNLNDSRQNNFGNDQFCGSPSSGNYCGFGYGWVNYSAGAVGRGGSWSNGANAGIFAAYLAYAPSSTNAGIGFRCVFQP